MLCEKLKGSIIGLSKSGFKVYLFVNRFQPADPSKKIHHCQAVPHPMVKCCNFPLGSVNLRSTKSTCLSFISLRIVFESHLYALINL